MTQRQIARDENILSGRWHFEGTSIPVAAVVADFAATGLGSTSTYRFAGLSQEEIAAALTFEFPAVRPVEAEIQYVSVSVDCVCGETTRRAVPAPQDVEITCPCRRTWRVTVTPELVDSATRLKSGS